MLALLRQIALVVFAGAATSMVVVIVVVIVVMVRATHTLVSLVNRLTCTRTPTVVLHAPRNHMLR
jgi:hypothetical protein